MEDEVAGLAQVAALGGDRSLSPSPSRTRPPCSRLTRSWARAASSRVVERADAVALGVAGEPRQARRRPRRLGAQGIEVVLGARDDAADERDEQQQVDRREPGRAVDVERLQLVEERREVWVVGEVLGDAVRVARALRNEGAGNRGDGEEQQQEQRGAHAGELAPEPAQPADDAELRLHDVIAAAGAVRRMDRRMRRRRCGRRGGAAAPRLRHGRLRARRCARRCAHRSRGARSHQRKRTSPPSPPAARYIHAVQTPVTISTPIAMSSTPPMMLIVRICRLKNVTARSPS